LILQVAGVRQGYRRLRDPEDVDGLIATLIERFQRREENDLERIRQVLRFAAHTGCLTQYVLAYFGEVRDVCGHCARCKGVDHPPLPDVASPTLDADDRTRIRALLDEKHGALRTPRQQARFLCGLTSPATTKAKLRKHGMFGAYETVPFKTVLEFVEGAG
jgi:ATP-dependent DNA helicase RecQ